MTVIIGIDPHKRSHTAVALDQHDQVLGELRVAADSFQLRLLKFAGAWTDRVWGVENANGLGGGSPGSWSRPGIGNVGAATVLSIVGDVSRFPTAAAFATFNGTAPIAASSGDKVRYRLNRGGQRQLNRVLHIAAKTQRRLQGPGRDYIERRLAEGKTNAEATRALKRHLSNVVYRTLIADQQTTVSGEDKRVA